MNYRTGIIAWKNYLVRSFSAITWLVLCVWIGMGYGSCAAADERGGGRQGQERMGEEK